MKSYGLARGLGLGAKAPGADVDFLSFSLYDYGSLVYVGQPATLGTPFRMAYVIPKLDSLAADITLHGTVFASPY